MQSDVLEDDTQKYEERRDWKSWCRKEEEMKRFGGRSARKGTKLLSVLDLTLILIKLIRELRPSQDLGMMKQGRGRQR